MKKPNLKEKAGLGLTRQIYRTAGFTLVEMAIVLIVVGIVLVGILKGQEIYSVMQLKRTYAHVVAYRSAVKTFEDKYKALPGDMQNADENISECGALAACVDGGGDGNKIIGSVGVTNWSRNDQSAAGTEATQFWLHLSLTDLITGVSGENVTDWGALYPAAPIRGGFHVLHAKETGTDQADGHYFVLRVPPTGDPHPDPGEDGALSPHEVAFLDRKFDDGVPNAGGIISDNVGNTCWNATTDQFLATDEDLRCITAFRFEP